MPLSAAQEYISIGGNRHSAASAWSNTTGCLAFGADQNVALWKPLGDDGRGVHQILQGHTDKVTAISSRESESGSSLVSGSADGEIIIWSLCEDGGLDCIISRTKAHDGAVNNIATSADSDYIVTGGADATVKVWRWQKEGIHLVVAFKPNPRLIPLALAIGAFPDTTANQTFFVAVAGTRNDIQIYAVQPQVPKIELNASLSGHEGWIRSLALRKSQDGYILASTSADKYTRLWRFQSGEISFQRNHYTENDVSAHVPTLTAKVMSVSSEDKKYSITFEALLLGHEDWVYSADWQKGNEERLLTASADGTLAIWEPDLSSGIWVSETRLGEISGQKGATTATGSSGGFWTGKWISKDTVISLGRTGSWRLWQYDANNMFWDLKYGIGGHVNSVTSICWSPMDEYLLSTSSDQTTRLHAEWTKHDKRTWHEFSRCQIHGYDCNTVICISSSQFVSGADEKLLRVFNEPRELAEALCRLCGVTQPADASMPETAAVPVLGLSNKEMGEPDDIIEAGPRKGEDDYAIANAMAGLSIREIQEPPTEDLLSRHTLWPEHEKLYGHGYEISEAAHFDGILATACKASSLDHATIRLYDTHTWKQIGEPLKAHSLTVTRLAWGHNHLLSVGRDRQWTLFKRRQPMHQEHAWAFDIHQAMPKAHTRMILDAAFLRHGAHPVFATAGRDKMAKLWGEIGRFDGESPGNGNDDFKLYTTITRPSAVTAVDITHDESEAWGVLALGEENGSLSIHFFDLKTLTLLKSYELGSLTKPLTDWRGSTRRLYLHHVAEILSLL